MLFFYHPTFIKLFVLGQGDRREGIIMASRNPCAILCSSCAHAKRTTPTLYCYTIITEHDFQKLSGDITLLQGTGDELTSTFILKCLEHGWPVMGLSPCVLAKPVTKFSQTKSAVNKLRLMQQSGDVMCVGEMRLLRLALQEPELSAAQVLAAVQSEEPDAAKVKKTPAKRKRDRPSSKQRH